MLIHVLVYEIFPCFDEGCFRFIIFELDYDLSRMIFVCQRVSAPYAVRTIGIVDIQILDIQVVFQVGYNPIKVFAIVFLNASNSN